MLYRLLYKCCIITSMFLDSVPKSSAESDTVITELTNASLLMSQDRMKMRLMKPVAISLRYYHWSLCPDSMSVLNMARHQNYSPLLINASCSMLAQRLSA